MRLHQVMSAAARAEISEQNRQLQSEIENDPFVMAAQVGTGVASSLAVGKKLAGMPDSQLEASKKYMYENDIDKYKQIFGDEPYVAPGGRKKLFGEDGVFDGSLLKGLFKNDNDKPNNNLLPPNEMTVAGTVVANDGAYGNLVESVKVDGENYNPTYTFNPEIETDEFNKVMGVDGNTTKFYEQKPDVDASYDTKKYDSVTDYLQEVEGFSAKSYYDENAYRYGYGTDTFITADGDSLAVTKRGKMSKISKEDAKKQLEMQIDKTFRKELRTKFGKDFYDELPKGVRIGLESLAYNAGSDLNDKNGEIKKAILAKDFNKAADLIASQVPKDSKLFNRRQQEAAFVRGSNQESVPGPVKTATASTVNEKSWMTSANTITAEIMGFEGTNDFRNYMDEEIVERDAAGNVSGFNPKLVSRVNGYVDKSVDFIKSTKIARMVGEYNEIIRRDEDYSQGYNPNTQNPLGNTQSLTESME